MIRYRIRQDGTTVASADSEAEIWNYAWQYRQDGEITIQHNAEGHWKRFALLCQWPSPAIEAQP